MDKKAKRPIGIDLFAGAGGLSLGFEQAGFDIAAAIEIDPIHCATHEFNFPFCKTICSDISKIDGQDIISAANIADGGLDVVFGGAPCQGFSMIGKRALHDPRNKLIFHFTRIVLELKPKYFVFENVKGLTIGKHKRFLNEIVELFEQSDYRIVLPYKVLNAADYGVPQDRHRLFLVGARADMQLPLDPDEREPVTVLEAIGDLPEAENFPELLTQDFTYAQYGQASNYAKHLRGIKNGHFGYRRKYDRNLLTCSLRTNHSDLSRKRFKETAHGKTEPVSRFHKLDPSGVSNTIRAGTASDRGAYTSPRPIHPFTPRCITVREAARLHSYPDWFRFHATKWHGFRQIGNSVPPFLGKAVAEKIIQAMGLSLKKPSRGIQTGNLELLRFSMSQAASYYGVPHDIIPKRQRN